MANFPGYRYTATGSVLYCTLRNAAGQYWDTTGTPAYETLDPANWGDYDIALTETPASSYQYIGAVPATLTAHAVVYQDIFLRVGGSVAITDTLLATRELWWNGTAICPMASDAVQISSSAAAANNVESVFLGTGVVDDVDLAARSLTITNDVASAVVLSSTYATGPGGRGLYIQGAGIQPALELVATGTGSGLKSSGGTGAPGAIFVGASGQYDIDVTTRGIGGNLHGTVTTVTTAGLSAAAVDDIWNESLAGHTTALTSGLYLGLLGAGVGVSTKTYTLTNSVGGSPLANVEVTVSTDNPPTAFIANGHTDVNGQFTFSHGLPAGTTVYLWRFHPGYSFTDPDTETL